MKQPNPFWTLETPKANFIGLYTNVPEGGAVKDDQKAWLSDPYIPANSPAIGDLMDMFVFPK